MIAAGALLLDALPADERGFLAQMLRPFAAARGTVLFREGDEADGLYVVERGRLSAALRAPGGAQTEVAQIGAGAIVGEMSLMGSGQRTATILALEDTSGWMLDRGTWEVLQVDRRPGSLALVRRVGALAVERLRERYAAIARALGADDAFAPARLGELEEIVPEPGEIDYLHGVLFFSRSTRQEVADVVAGARRLAAARGAQVTAAGEAPPALYLVVRGALEVTIRGGDRAKRVRLAGPGRLVGHLGILDSAPGVETCVARERSILVEFSWDRVGALLAGSGGADRAFALAFYQDVVRALLHAQRPVPALAPAPQRRSVAAQPLVV